VIGVPAIVKVGMIRMALTFKNNEEFWFVVGRTQTPWDDETNPPQESVDTVMLTEIGGLQKAQTVSLCYPDLNGVIEFRGQRYSLVSDDYAYDYDSRYLYCSTILKFDEFPLVTFRQFGLLVGVVPTAGNETKSILLPEEVQDYGKLLGYVNIPPISRTAGSKNLLEIVIELVPEVTI
jgi:hypothetical protein